ncbi:hypothetical protein [Marinobacterium aestuariivivens]|uniref:Na+/H+ antiporter NhaC-like C-terminal domain-containing protein n=1 Tax=Marinobacterium aestuariivivens TaxID=1698799 RepID=A0ABW2A4A9_9GAMM
MSTSTEAGINLSQTRLSETIAVSLIVLAVIGFALYSFQTIGSDGSFGLLSLLPTLVVIATALYTKRTIESLFIGVLVGLLMTNSPAAFIPALGTTFLDVFMNDTVAWIFIACGLMGSMISLVTLGAAPKPSAAGSPPGCIRRRAPCSRP